MQPALLWKKMGQDKVRCLVCQRKCLINEGKLGFCQTRINQKGKLYSLIYGVINHGIQIDPIEKKPFYHFLPGNLVPSIGSLGCNFRCQQCLNFTSSWGAKITTHLPTISPADLITQIKKAGYHGIAFTYNEPVIWLEYVLAVAKLAKKADFFALFVTNGSWTKETLAKIGPFIDAANIDFKGFSEKTYSKQGALFKQIPEMAIYAQKKYQIFLEITTLLIPTINDDPRELQSMTDWIVKNLGPKIPWHLSRFDPQLAATNEFQQLPATSVEALQKAKAIGQKSGLKFIYIWPSENNDTVCPKCGSIAIRRHLWQPEIVGVDSSGTCRKCHEDLNLVLK